MLFLDASVLVKAYIEEDGSKAVRAAMKRLDGFLVTSDVVAIEVLNTFRRKLNRGSLSESAYKAARVGFYAAYPAFRVRQIGQEVVDGALKIAGTHAQKSVGGVDVLHLATALDVQEELPAGLRLSFATTDDDLKQLAKRARMLTFDPRTDPLSALPRRPRL